MIALVHGTGRLGVETALRDGIDATGSFDFVIRTAVGERRVRIRGRVFGEPAGTPAITRA